MKESPSPSAAPEIEGMAHTRLLREDLLALIETRLAAAPGSVDLQTERAHLLAELERPKEAAQAYHLAVNSGPQKYPVTSRAYSLHPFHGKGLPITVLLLVAPGWGNAPFRKYLDDQTFLNLQIITHFHDPDLPLPPHQLVINCISDADSCRTSLEAAILLLAKTDTPLINPPGEILATTREGNAQRFASIPGVRTPKTALFPRAFLESSDVPVLESSGFSFPLLARSPGYHTGEHFIRAENPAELRAALPSLPGDEICIIEYLNARNTDGLIRKYRVLMIDGKLYPAHMAISDDWKVHLFSSATTVSAEHRMADQDFLENMPVILGTRVMEALGRIQEALKLDYAGIDFSLDARGNILVFEANATMNVNPPSSDEIWSYRRAPVQRIADAVRTLVLKKAFSRIDPATSSPTEALREFTLRQLESRLKLQPGRIEFQIEQVRLLIALERFNEAKNILMGILTKEPTHVVALFNLGILLNMLGYYEDAQKMYRAVVALSPGLIQGRLNLARLLREEGELKEARAHYETILQAMPDHAEAHRDLAYVLRYQNDYDAAREHQKIAARTLPSINLPAHTSGELPRLLILLAPCGGNSPLTRYLDKKAFDLINVIPDSCDPSEPLPPHRLIVNAIADADHCGPSLEPLARILEQSTTPVINRPDRIGMTGRAENSRLLGALDGVVTPRFATISSEILAGSKGISTLEELGFTYPILLRSPGFHQGKHFVRVETPDALAAAVTSLPGQHQMAIQYLDARDDDGKIRKYRVMMIDGKLYPLHKAVSQKWMIHYFSAEMADSARHRAEDEAFLADMPSVLGSRAVLALERIRDALGLDYAGADFSIGRGGEILLFEANASMSVPLPQPGDQWEYRRAPAARIQNAVREMILSRTGTA